MRLSLILPVRDAAAELFCAAVTLHSAGVVRVIFSDDGTVQAAGLALLQKARDMGCVVLDKPAQAKPGNAAKRGLLYYVQQPGGHVGVITCGLNTILSAQTLQQCARAMPRGGQALVLGVREQQTLSDAEKQRGDRAQALLTQQGCHLQDPLSGVYLFPNALAQACVQLPQEGASWQVNLLLAAAQNKVPFFEVPLPPPAPAAPPTAPQDAPVASEAPPVVRQADRKETTEPDALPVCAPYYTAPQQRASFETPSVEERHFEERPVEERTFDGEPLPDEGFVPLQFNEQEPDDTAPGGWKKAMPTAGRADFARQPARTVRPVPPLPLYEAPAHADKPLHPQDIPNFSAPRKWIKRNQKR